MARGGHGRCFEYWRGSRRFACNARACAGPGRRCETSVRRRELSRWLRGWPVTPDRTAAPEFLVQRVEPLDCACEIRIALAKYLRMGVAKQRFRRECDRASAGEKASRDLKNPDAPSPGRRLSWRHRPCRLPRPAFSSPRSNFTISLLPRRKPCFQPSTLWRACWAASSSEPKSKIMNECAMCLLYRLPWAVSSGGPGVKSAEQQILVRPRTDTVG